jgi:hypothetical protein
VAALKARLDALRPDAVQLAKRTSEKRWAGYLGAPLLIVLGLLVLVLVNLSQRSLWGQVFYAVAVTTAVVWALGRVLCRYLDIPLISLARSFLWAVFAVVAFPVAVAHGFQAVVVLFGLPLLWLLAHIGKSDRIGSVRLPPWSGLVAGMAALALYVVLSPRVAGAETPPAAASVATAEDRAQAALARRVRPVLLFDENEARYPLDIGAAISSRLIAACRAALGSEPCEIIEREADVDLSADYLDVTDVVGPRGGGPSSSIYYRVTESPRRVYVDYWWYFTRNPTPVAAGVFCAPGFQLPGLTCHEHPSDWEGATMVFGPCERFGPPCLTYRGNRWAPAAVRYAQHEFVVSYAWRPTLLRLWSARRGRPLFRPLVYVANNSHASYPQACRQGCKQLRTILGRAVSESAHDGRVPWSRNNCTGCVRRLPLTQDDLPALWNAFGGRWGTQTCILAGSYCDASRAPGAPSKQSRYRDPGRSGPWLCLARPGDETARGLVRCGGDMDPDAGVPGFARGR